MMLAVTLLLLVPILAAAQDGTVVVVPIQLENVGRVELTHHPDDSYTYALHGAGGVRELSPGEFAAYVYDANLDRPFIRRLFNISGTVGIAWVAFGFAAQLMFTARMLLQWIASEKHRKSIIPVAFWWLSLVGGVMLLVYFVWRKDIVGVCGQMMGVVVYTRNLMLIARRTGVEALADTV